MMLVSHAPLCWELVLDRDLDGSHFGTIVRVQMQLIHPNMPAENRWRGGETAAAMASKGKKLSKKEIRTAAGKQRKREQRTAVAEAWQGAETLDPGATTTSGELLDMRWRCR